MPKRELVRHAVTGSLRLYDSECTVRWDNLPDAERLDWFELFDMCRDEPTRHTEAVIQAIMAGMRPQVVDVTASVWHRTPSAGRPRIWFFRPGEAFAPPCILPAAFAEPTHYIGGGHGPCGPRACIPAEHLMGRWHRRFRKNAHAIRAFRHVAHAWSYLLSFL